MSHIIKLSTKNFERASNLKGNEEFCFIVGKHQIYCHLFVAGFLSEKVSKMLISDPTTNKYFFKIASDQENSEYEQKITNFLQKLIKGEKYLKSAKMKSIK